LLVEGFDSATVWAEGSAQQFALPFWQDLLPKLKTLIIVRNPLKSRTRSGSENGTSYSFGCGFGKSTTDA